MTSLISQGGSYRDDGLANNGDQVHHIPAYGAYSESGLLSKNDGPAIWMTVTDHRQTASWRRRGSSEDYRQQQKELIDQGRFHDALRMDIEDIRSKFGDKYNVGLQQAKDYSNEQVDPNIFTI